MYTCLEHMFEEVTDEDQSRCGWGVFFLIILTFCGVSIGTGYVYYSVKLPYQQSLIDAPLSITNYSIVVDSNVPQYDAFIIVSTNASGCRPIWIANDDQRSTLVDFLQKNYPLQSTIDTGSYHVETDGSLTCYLDWDDSVTTDYKNWFIASTVIVLAMTGIGLWPKNGPEPTT